VNFDFIMATDKGQNKQFNSRFLSRLYRKVRQFIQGYWKYFVLVLAVVGSVTALIYSGCCRIHTIETSFSGEYVDRDVVQSIANEYYDYNFFTIQYSDLRARLEAIDYVKNVFLIKHFPNKIQVNIIEYKPRYVVIGSDGCMVWSNDYVLVLISDNKEDCAEFLLNSDVANVEVSDNIKITEISDNVVKDIYKINKVVEFLGIKNANYNVNKDYFIVYFGDKSIWISRQADLDIQLKRLLLVMQKINDEHIRYKKLKLEYKRPVAET